MCVLVAVLQSAAPMHCEITDDNMMHKLLPGALTGKQSLHLLYEAGQNLKLRL